MIFVIQLIAVLVTAITFFLSAFLLAEVVASLGANNTKKTLRRAPGAVAVIIPAHNEEKILGVALDNVKSQLRQGDRLIVVADNCTDNTAAIAGEYGAECLVRNDAQFRGKGYALQFAIDALRQEPPDIVVFMDADCLFDAGALMLVASAAAGEGRPVQALYLMKAPAAAAPRQRVAEFAWLFINQVRMLGLQRLFNVTRFTGAGFAAPWNVIAKADMASGQIVEDLALTFDLTEQKTPPMLLTDALVTSEFPESEVAQMKQSARWSIGSIAYAWRSGLLWLAKGASKGNVNLIGAALDLMIPPLTIFLLVILGAMGLAVLSFFVGGDLALMLSAATIALTAAAIGIGWLKYGRAVLPASEFVALGTFLGSKLSVFGAKGRATAKTWTSTRSEDPHDQA